MSAWGKQRAGNDLPSLWKCVSCGFIIHAAESHTEAAELLLNGTIFRKTEKDEVRKGTQKWKKAFAISNGAIRSSGRHQDNLSARFVNKQVSRSMRWTLFIFCLLQKWGPEKGYWTISISMKGVKGVRRSTVMSLYSLQSPQRQAEDHNAKGCITCYWYSDFHNYSKTKKNKKISSENTCGIGVRVQIWHSEERGSGKR